MATPSIASTTARVQGLSLDDDPAAEQVSHSLSAASPSSASSAFVFGAPSGNDTQDTAQDIPFTFRAVFNATPQPSRAPSTEPQNGIWTPQSTPHDDWSSILSTPPQRTPYRPRSRGGSQQATPHSQKLLASPQVSSRASPPLADRSPALTSASSTPSPFPPILTPSTTLSRHITGSTRNPISRPATEPSLPVAGLPASTTPVHFSAPELPATLAQALSSGVELPIFASGTPPHTAPVTPRVTPATPYDPRDETTPDHAFFTADLQGAIRDSCRIARDAARAITNADIGPDTDQQRLLGEAESLQNFQGSDTRTIAVLGDSGEGKSSLINSLLHVSGLAFTSDIGSACTSIATEYRQKKPEQAAPFTIEVEYLSTTEIEEHIRELLWNYRRLYLPDVNSANTTEADYRKYERESEQAWYALETAFKHRGSEFTPQIAKDMSEGAEERLLRKLTEWANSIQWPQSQTGSEGADGFWTATAGTTEECIELTKKFMHDRYWPFTKIIRVYLSAQILKMGVVLTDLPGLHDTNLARVRVTQDYLLRSDHVLIVAKISRAMTDQSLRSSLFLALARHIPTEWETGAKRLNIAVVCTRTEDINLIAARAEFVGDNKRIAPAAMDRLDREIAAARLAGDRDRKKAAKREQELLLIQARNDHVTEGLQRTYAAETDGRALDVFCVSNKWYEKYCPKGHTALVRASGIPALRRFCHTVAADAQLGEALYFLRSRLPSLLNSLDLWAANALAKDADATAFDPMAIYRKADIIKSQMFKLAANFQQSLGECFDEQIMKFFGERGHEWNRAASKEGRQWMVWHHTQYNAWCNNDGEHETAKRNYLNWNAQIIWKMRTELEFQWELLLEHATTGFRQMFDSASELLESLQAEIQEDAAVFAYVDALVESIDSKLWGLKYRLGREERAFLGEVRAKRRYLSEANCSSYIAREMRPKYRKAANQSGTGRMARQHSIVQGHIEDDVLFHLLGSALSAEMGDLLKKTQSTLQEIIEEVFDGIMSDIDLAFTSGLQSAEPTVRDEAEEVRLREFAHTVERLRNRHESLSGKIEAL